MTKLITLENQINYERIAKAIDYIKTHFKSQPSLEDIAEKINLSPHHFQRLFSEWAGISPKKFLQYISVQHAKHLLKHKQLPLFDAAHDTGLSGTSRLHDLFINIEGMSPNEYKNGGEHLIINYSFNESRFGHLLVASTKKGICYMAFYETKNLAFALLKAQFPNAKFEQKTDFIQQSALFVFTDKWHNPQHIKLHLKGSHFQLKVWETLLKVPMGQITTYGDIASRIKKPKASRAVGTAIGKNPIAYLIPCHRVIQANGNLGGYMWGATRKTAIIAWECAKTNNGI